jgi:nicotinamide-nucleotide adenylyltransferase
MKKYKVALFIGRFQPFHNGHLYSLKKCLELAERVIVGIGSSQESNTENNPWDFETRKEMIEALREESLEIVAIPDLFDDQRWGDQLLSVLSARGFVVAEVVGVGNNDWTNRIFKAVGIDVYETGLYKRDELEGIKIRELMKKNDITWKARVPESIVKWMNEYDRSK